LRPTPQSAAHERAVVGGSGTHISEDELEVNLADLKNQIGNLRLMIEATEADLSQRR
jgi:uncharacterized small protein (DUF1192 family)